LLGRLRGKPSFWVNAKGGAGQSNGDENQEGGFDQRSALKIQKGIERKRRRMDIEEPGILVEGAGQGAKSAETATY